MDADNGIVSLALTVYEIENIETWTWLLEILHLDFEKGSNHIPFSTDGQKKISEQLRSYNLLLS